MSDVNDFIKALQEIKKGLSSAVKLTDGVEHRFGLLSTSQYKRIVQTIVDKTLMKTSFINTIADILKENKPEELDFSKLNVVDRLLYTLEAKLQSTSPTIQYESSPNEKIEVDFAYLKNNILNVYAERSDLLKPATFSENGIEIQIGIPTIQSEVDANNLVYNRYTTDINYTTNETNEMLGSAFIAELAKGIKHIKTESKEIDTNLVSFQDRINIIEILPATLIKAGVKHIELIKNVTKRGLTVDGVTINVDASLFTI